MARAPASRTMARSLVPRDHAPNNRDHNRRLPAGSDLRRTARSGCRLAPMVRNGRQEHGIAGEGTARVVCAGGEAKQGQTRSIWQRPRNVKWGVKICEAVYSTPSVAGGKILRRRRGARKRSSPVLDAATGKLLWQWKAPARKFPHDIDGFSIGISEIPQQMGVCSSAAVDGDRVYFVSNRFEVVCLDVHGQRAGPRPARRGSCGSSTCGTSWACFPATRPTARR